MYIPLLYNSLRINVFQSYKRKCKQDVAFLSVGLNKSFNDRGPGVVGKIPHSHPHTGGPDPHG